MTAALLGKFFTCIALHCIAFFDSVDDPAACLSRGVHFLHRKRLVGGFAGQSILLCSGCLFRGYDDIIRADTGTESRKG